MPVLTGTRKAFPCQRAIFEAVVFPSQDLQMKAAVPIETVCPVVR